jgi:ferritin
MTKEEARENKIDRHQKGKMATELNIGDEFEDKDGTRFVVTHKTDREEMIRLRIIEEENKLPPIFLKQKAQREEEQRLEENDIRNHCKLLQDGKTLQALIPFIKKQIEDLSLSTTTLHKGMLLAYQELEEFINNHE